MNVRIGAAPSSSSTSMEKSIWNTSPLPQPPAARNAAIVVSEYAAGAAPETSWVQVAPGGK